MEQVPAHWLAWSGVNTAVFLRVLVFFTAGCLAQAAEPLEEISSFLEQYCVDCHGPEKQKGEYRFDTLGTDLTDLITLETWQGILDQLNLGEMPPAKQPQPSHVEAARIIDTLTPILEEAYANLRSTGGEAVIRRLNKFELRNTLRDLFGIHHPDFEPTVISGLYDFNGNGITAQKTIEPTRSFQDDEESEGFDNIGQKLVMSDFLLKMIIGAAEECVDHVTVRGDEKKLKAQTFTAPICTKTIHGDSMGKYQRAKKDPYDEIFQRWDRYNRIGPDIYHGGMKHPGFYRVTIEVSAHKEQNGWGNWTVREGNLIYRGRQDSEEPFRLGLYRERYEHLRGPRADLLTQWTLPGDGKKRTFSFETWIDHTWSTWVGWENGPWFRHNAFHVLLEQWYPDENEKIERKNNKGFKKEVAEALFRRGYQGPTVRVHKYTVEPLPTPWPPESHVALYGSGDPENTDLLKRYRAFAERAYRRPVSAEEIEPFLALTRQLEENGNSRMDAMKGAYCAILCSPDFIYLRQAPGRLEDYALASRLSYFLWSSMPDDALFDAAKSGQLSKPEELSRQVERMLADPKAKAFVRHFPERWLKLFELGRMEPDKKGPYGIYFRVKDDLRRQVDAYFGDLLERNGPIRELVESDYTFLNQGLAEHIYKRTDVVGTYFRKVSLQDGRRGGLLTTPAVMTVTANGVETSPILRGVYVLENILGTPPPAPPPDVEPLSPDLRGVKSLKEQLAVHRDQEACSSCHRKIDPMGFALESFDPIGRIRDAYPKIDKKARTAPPIDTTAVLANGQEIKNVDEFKAMLLDREQQIAHSLTEKMLTYASGRLLETTDRGEVNRITSELSKNGYRLRDLVHLVVSSDIFLNK